MESNKRVITLIRESDILLLDKYGLLNSFAACHTQMIVNNVVGYITSNPNTEVAALLKKAFSVSIKKALANMDNSDLFKYMDYLKDFKLTDINAGLDEDKLRNINFYVSELLDSDSVDPYINPISKQPATSLFEMLKVCIKNCGDPKDKAALNQLNAKLNTLKHCLSDSVNAKSKGTPFKNLTYNSTIFNVMKEGTEFLLDMKSKNIEPARWRHF